MSEPDHGVPSPPALDLDVPARPEAPAVLGGRVTERRRPADTVRSRR